MIGLYLRVLETCKHNPTVEYLVWDWDVRAAGGKPPAFQDLCVQAGLTPRPIYGGVKYVFLLERNDEKEC